MEAEKSMRKLKLSVVALVLALVFVVGSSVYAADRGNTKFQSFNKVKRLLFKEVYYDHLVTFYCGCPFTMDKKIIPSDRYTRRKNRKKLTGWNGST